jgi:prophage regulatory protein
MAEMMKADRILRRDVVLNLLGISSATLHRRLKDGSVPPPLRLGPNSVGWRESSIQAVIDSYQIAVPIPVAPGVRRGRKPSAVGRA